eukprot:3918948-Rhodomonas_salina.1
MVRCQGTLPLFLVAALLPLANAGPLCLAGQQITGEDEGTREIICSGVSEATCNAAKTDFPTQCSWLAIKVEETDSCAMEIADSFSAEKVKAEYVACCDAVNGTVSDVRTCDTYAGAWLVGLQSKTECSNALGGGTYQSSMNYWTSTKYACCKDGKHCCQDDVDCDFSPADYSAVCQTGTYDGAHVEAFTEDDGSVNDAS